MPGMAINVGQVAEVIAQGPAYTAQQSITAPGTIAASGTYASGVLPTFGNPHIAVAAELSNAGTISLQRYLDNAGSLAIGAAVTLALTAGTLGVLDNVTTAIAQSFSFAVINGGGSAGTLTNAAVVLAAK